MLRPGGKVDVQDASQYRYLGEWRSNQELRFLNLSDYSAFMRFRFNCCWLCCWRSDLACRGATADGCARPVARGGRTLQPPEDIQGRSSLRFIRVTALLALRAARCG